MQPRFMMANVSERTKNIIQVLIVFCVPVLLYLQSITFGFTGFDDNILILDNATYLGDFKNAARVFFTDAFVNKTTPFYRPLQTLTYMVDIQLSGGINVAAFHLTNVLLLGFISSLLFLVLKKFLVPPRLAVLATLLYCVHPLFISSIVWIPARGDLLLTLFALLSLIFFINYLNTESLPQLIMHWFTFTLALFCKETAALLPAIFITYCFTVFGHKSLKTRYPLLVASYVITGLFWYGLRSKAIFNLPSENAVFGTKAIISNIRTIPESLASFFLPFNIAPIPYFSYTKTIIGIVVVMVIAGIFILNKVNDNKTSFFCILWFLFLLFPTLLFKHHLIDYLNHRFILPLIGILIFICINIPRKWVENKDAKNIKVLLPVIILLSYYTFITTLDYKNPMTFYNSALSMNPKSALAYNNRGVLKRNVNDTQGAIDDFNRAIQIYPAYEEAHNNRGLAKWQSGDHVGSITDFDTAISINKAYPNPYYHRGRAYYDMHDYRRAIADFSSYASMSKVHLDEYNYIGKSLAQIGNYQEAIKYFNEAIAVNQNQYMSYVNRSIAKYYLKDYAGVIEDCDKALALQPGDKNASSLRTKALNELKESSSKN